MRTEPTAFYSEGLKLDASFYLPDAGQEDPSRPIVIVCSGFMGLNRIHPARFGRVLTPHGFTTFGFDYRGFGDSEGTPGRVLLEEQVTDIAHAAAFAAQHANAGGGRVVLIGWGMGGGLVLEAAHHVPGLAGLACLNGFYNGRRVQLTVRGYDGYADFLGRLAEARAESARSGDVVYVNPFTLYPLDTQGSQYVDDVLYKVDGFGGDFSPMLADSLLRFSADDHLEGLSRVPLLVAHGDNNRMHPPIEAESLYARYPGPKQLFWLRGSGHTEFMDDENPVFQRLAGRVLDFLQGDVLATA